LAGVKRMPSWWISVSARERLAGTAPPMSVLWMWPEAKQSSSPSWKIGFHMCTSGAWVARKPEYGSLVKAMSPGS
jgi:hypothetical protein